jgi:hypothetical protein
MTDKDDLQHFRDETIALMQSADDDRIEILYNEYLERKEAAKLTNRALLYDAGREIAEYKLANEYINAMQMQYAENYDVGEYNLLMSEHVDATMGLIVIQLDIKPIIIGERSFGVQFISEDSLGLVDGVRGYGVSGKVSRIRSNGTVNVQVSIIELGDQTTLSTDIIFDRGDTYITNIECDIHDIINVSFIYHQALFDVQRRGIVVSENELDLETYETEDTYSLNHFVIVTVLSHNVVGGAYNDVVVKDEVKVRKQKLDNPKFSFGVISVSQDDDIEISISANWLDIYYDAKPQEQVYYNSVSLMLVNWLNKINTVKAYQLQTGVYGGFINGAMDELRAGNEVQQLMGQVIGISERLALLSSEVTRYKKVKYDLGMQTGMSLHEMVPFYASNVERHFGYNESGADLTARWHVDSTTFIGTISHQSWTVNITEKILVIEGASQMRQVIEVGETDQVRIFAILNLSRRPSPNTMWEDVNTDERDDTRIFTTSWTYLNDMTSGMGTLKQSVFIRKGKIFLKGQRAILAVSIGRIVVAPKNINGIPGHVSQNITVSFWCLGRYMQAKCVGGVPEQVITEQFGVMNGVGYDVAIGFEKEMYVAKPFILFSDEDLQERLMTITNDSGFQTDRVASTTISDIGSSFYLTTTYANSPSTGLELTIQKDMMLNFWSSEEKSPITKIDNITMPEWFALQNTEENQFLLMNQGIWIRVEGDCEINAPIPPVYLGVLNYANEYVYFFESILEEVYGNIQSNREAILDVKMHVQWLQGQFELFVSQQGESLWQVITNALINIVLDAAFGMIGGAVMSKITSVMQKMAGLNWRVTSTGIAQSVSRGATLKSLGSREIPTDSFGEMQNFGSTYLSSRKRKVTDFDYDKRPMFKQTDKQDHLKAQYFDASEKLDITSMIRAGGSYKAGDYPAKAIPKNSLSPSPNESLIPCINTYYRPLGILPQPVAKWAHKFTLRSDVKDKYVYDSVNLSTRQPSHAFSVVDDYEVIGVGKHRLNRNYIGIGELNVHGRTTGDKGAGIGGVTMTYDSTIRNRDGRVLYTLNDYETSGYNAKDVDNLYKTLYNNSKTGKELGDVLTTDEKWMSISEELSRKILQSDKMSSTYLPDKSKVMALQSMIRDPPEFNYNLINNNCQNLVKDMVNFVKNGTVNNAWQLTMRKRLLKDRVQLYDSVLGVSEARKMELADESNSKIRMCRYVLRHCDRFGSMIH